VTLSFTMSLSTEDFAVAQRALRAATSPADNPAEEPLVVQWDGVKAMVNARVIRRHPVAAQQRDGLQPGRDPVAGHEPAAAAPAAAGGRPISPPAAGGGGLIYPLTYPLVYGSAQSGGEMQLTNDGDAPAQPVFRITGPCTGPVITNADTGQQLAFDPGYLLPAGDQLTLTYENRSVLLDDGVSRSNELVTRQWFTLPVGTTRVRFTSADGLGLLEALYYSTSM
jgi:hypothetical protein